MKLRNPNSPSSSMKTISHPFSQSEELIWAVTQKLIKTVFSESAIIKENPDDIGYFVTTPQRGKIYVSPFVYDNGDFIVYFELDEKEVWYAEIRSCEINNEKDGASVSSIDARTKTYKGRPDVFGKADYLWTYNS